MSYLYYECIMCEKTVTVTTEEDTRKEEVNDAFVWGALSVGIGHYQSQEMMAILDVPIMDKRKWQRHEIRIEEVWEEKLETYMQKNGTVERKKALERGHVDNDGVPYISVYVDGAWCKRTYGHAFNAASGVACIIGVETNGLLFIGIKNKYCYVCNQTKPGEESKQHLCYKNFSGASTAMEQEILVQGFCESENMHGLRYKFIVGDGDSSTYVKIQQNVSYGRHVVKMECANHAVKNYTGKLHKIAKDTVHPISGRKCLSQLIPRLTRAARSAISSAGRSNSNSEILRADLRNGPHHVFGDHSNCRDTYCSRKDYNEEDKVALLLPTTLWPALQMALDPLVQKADRLVGNYTTNQAERFMSLVSKFSGGKRTDVGKKGRYKRCCLASGLSHVKGPHWHASPLKKMFGRSPGAICKKVFNTRARASERGIKRKSARQSLFKDEPPRKQKRLSAGADCNYGPQAAQPDIEPGEMESRKRAVLDRLENEAGTPELCSVLEKKTVGQHGNIAWREARLDRLTASLFMKVCKMRDDTSCHNNVVAVVNPREINTDAVKYGRINEPTAIKIYESKFGDRVAPCGLFVDPEHPYLGASPDGIISSDRIIEIKCLPSLNQLKLKNPSVTTIRDACKIKKMAVHLNSKGEIILDKKSSYYYQLQGQLNICRVRYATLVLFCDFDTEFISVERDVNFWSNEMLPKLKRFYLECVLPEIADPRHSRGLRCRDPDYIREAQERKKITKGKNSASTRDCNTTLLPGTGKLLLKSNSVTVTNTPLEM
ncbi:uncharacterized protein LOC134531105 isoform X1 [Bacillus rossius redtenbacheri]